MGDADEPKINPVAAMENWKAAVIKEQAVASNFTENWGYLKAKPEECKPRAFETRLVKYFNHGVATVREKRLALEGEARGDTPPTPETDKTPEDAERAKKMMMSATYMSTNGDYGSRGSLELFGVAQHGLRSDITKHSIY
mmetsp:Transcript_34173/g.66777  ORF Transcript_34173/g.66777 Transcript_34173/m.66777 type:complete len:140 (+) Transcript_34173:110-529(+)|eukprot:CAMPEP_0173386306 /NCGR_PEP_ID=MMETSP1356-20130122/8906_1 /TAXON_ID=77927 ORGANISM="Hemiselmis virescens, Strain PCC157" /NCGR_SAMPLE_ID=MMETSP1356 /ASSEMBLY_ACC=CAM_ASM_000847 /LENGTH=139 /DNA_ID=CAMNT_0014342487 /DNA_START=109 /DNA_END=528 /DNA_ORIENTATION=+